MHVYISCVYVYKYAYIHHACVCECVCVCVCACVVFVCVYLEDNEKKKKKGTTLGFTKTVSRSCWLEDDEKLSTTPVFFFNFVLLARGWPGFFF
jgi:hypothetical protein